jgi:hypothetical protein
VRAIWTTQGPRGYEPVAHGFESPSSRGPGPRLFTSLTGVRLPLGTQFRCRKSRIRNVRHSRNAKTRAETRQGGQCDGGERFTNIAPSKVCASLLGSRVRLVSHIAGSGPYPNRKRNGRLPAARSRRGRTFSRSCARCGGEWLRVRAALRRSGDRARHEDENDMLSARQVPDEQTPAWNTARIGCEEPSPERLFNDDRRAERHRRFDVARQRQRIGAGQVSDHAGHGTRVRRPRPYRKVGERCPIGPNQPRDARHAAAQASPASCTRAGSSPVSK